jgi:hypothetical protein
MACDPTDGSRIAQVYFFFVPSVTSSRYCHGNQFVSRCLPHYARCDQKVTLQEYYILGCNVEYSDRLLTFRRNVLLLSSR